MPRQRFVILPLWIRPVGAAHAMSLHPIQSILVGPIPNHGVIHPFSVRYFFVPRPNSFECLPIPSPVLWILPTILWLCFFWIRRCSVSIRVLLTEDVICRGLQSIALTTYVDFFSFEQLSPTCQKLVFSMFFAIETPWRSTLFFSLTIQPPVCLFAGWPLQCLVPGPF